MYFLLLQLSTWFMDKRIIRSCQEDCSQLQKKSTARGPKKGFNELTVKNVKCSKQTPSSHFCTQPWKVKKFFFSDPMNKLYHFKSPVFVWNIVFDELDFFPSLKWIFLPAVACKIQVWNRLKIQFIKLDISNWRIAKIKCR